MSPVIVFPDEFAYVGAALVSTAFLLQWQSFKVAMARRKAKIDYPQLYAEKAEVEKSETALVFNCVQRAHQNTLENMPLVIIGTLLSGLEYPRYAASLCGLFTFGRILYTIGYSTGVPKKRNTFGGGGSLSSISGLLLVLGAGYTVFGWINKL